MNPTTAASGHAMERRSNVRQRGTRVGVKAEIVLLDHLAADGDVPARVPRGRESVSRPRASPIGIACSCALLLSRVGGPRRRNTMTLEHRSSAAWRGLPLVHVQFGTRELGGRYRPGRPRGVIAVGDIAVGAVAVGPVAIGVVAIGAAALGIVSVGAAALGVVAVGAAAVGVLAVGVATLGVLAIGVVSLGWHAVGIEVTSSSVLLGAFRRRTGAPPPRKTERR